MGGNRNGHYQGGCSKDYKSVKYVASYYIPHSNSVLFLDRCCNLFNVFMLQRIKSLYRERRYEESASKMLPITIIGAISGFVFYGYYLYTLYSYLDDIVMKKYLIRSKEEPIHFPPPYIPKKRD